jgi:cytosine deaminase
VDLLIRQVRIADDQPLQDVAVEGGRIVAIAPELQAEAFTIIEGEGRVLIPGLIEGHLHVDKTMIADLMPNRSGTFAEAMSISIKLKPTFTKEFLRERAETLLRMLMRHGVTHFRAQAEFDPVGGFAGFEMALEIKEKFKGIVDMQIVAFPQEGIFKAPGTEDMMREAVKMGADVIGGIPHNDLAAKQHIDFIFDLAKQHDLPLDVHVDQKESMEGTNIQYLCEKTIAEGYQGRVSVGHMNSLGVFPPELRDPIIEQIAKAGVTVMCLPPTDLHLGGRVDTHNVRRGMPPVRALRDGGVNVGLAANNIRNAFCPLGNGDPFLTAMLGVAAGHLGGADDLPTVLPMLTTNLAKALGLKEYGLSVGNKADMVLLDTKKVNEAIIDMAEKLYVIKDGRVVVETQRQTKMCI